MNDSLRTATVLAFERKLDCSDALFFGGSWESRSESHDWKSIKVREKSVRGTISNRLKTGGEQDPLKLDAKISNPNLQTVDVATLPSGADTLKVQFSLRIMNILGVPSACNNLEYQSKLCETIEKYSDSYRFDELARRYSFNLANGRFLWRNRLGAQEVEVRVSHIVDGEKQPPCIFDALSLSLQDFQPTEEASTSLEMLKSLLVDGLSKERPILLDITAFVRMGDRQEVFPSQELILDVEKKNGHTKSRTLYQVDGVAGMHSQKIGNAIRTIDTWYSDTEESGLVPIPIEPYGSVTTLGKAYRQPKGKQDFYSLLDGWLLSDKIPSTENQHYVMAILIRGGVFGKAESN